MKTPLIALAGALLMTAVPATSQDIIVSAEEAAAVELISRELDRNLVHADWPRQQARGEGLAMVRFQRDAGGRAVDVEFYRRSGSSSVDRLARRAVKRLGRNAPLPALGGADQIFQANIIVANSEQAFSDFASKLAKLEKTRLSDPRERRVFAFTASPRKAS
ncbi:energy transducer TonB [Erythrobacter sp.]|uniref:energy transducer TonB family protein n=1 Tax=Erythrobacter sp. TaxID=1042 RepID=UPI001B21A21B|nr:energy transducer TonB [Erythrobacter sp.]MBO6527505.1 energy transducer TonB [Erythrobacter sp.]MBO6530185.1 energy transducer TonB [Erythrobacter sp.]